MMEKRMAIPIIMKMAMLMATNPNRCTRVEFPRRVYMGRVSVKFPRLVFFFKIPF